MPVSSTTPQKWQLTTILMFRQILQDINSQNEEYNDEAVRDILVTAAKMVSGDLGLSVTYTVDTTTTFITPDPVEANDEAFINLILKRAHLMLLIGEWRKAVRKSAMIQLGPRVSMNTSVGAEVYGDLVKELKKQYQEELVKYRFNDLNGMTVIMSGTPVGPDYPGDDLPYPTSGEVSH